MRLQIHAVGRMKAGPERDLLDGFRKRLGVDLDIIEIDDRKVSGSEAEAEALLAHLPPGAPVVALDERGKEMTSRDFAARLARWHDDARQPVCFLIGGADGLHERARAAADLVLGFGRLTWPHMLARVMLVEQIYRAQSIIAGHPYHRE